MKKNFIWLFVSFLMVAALVLASCAPAVVEEKKATVVTKEPEKKAEKVEEVVEKVGPQYGGTISTFHTGTPSTWDREDLTGGYANTYFNFFGDTLLILDWWAARDRNIPLNNRYDHFNLRQLYTGSLAESFDWSDPLTMTFKIRKGVRWQNKPPANGREFVADDVVWFFERMLANPKRAGQVIQNIESVTATDKYTVVFKLEEPNTLMLAEIGIYEYLSNREVFEQYGNLRDWKTVVGTGPWMLTDHVPEVSTYFERNPDYFLKDPEGNTMPYIDTIKVFSITDVSTQTAALRTAKIDKTQVYNPVPWDQKPSLENTCPDLQFASISGGSMFNVYMKTTKEPTSNLKVRQAMAMAVNRPEMNDALLGGSGHPFSWPAHSSWLSYTPIEELPPNIREIYEWKPENVAKAKQLLADAGYPNGFETSVQYNIGGAMAPFAQGMELLKSYWAAIGIKLELRPHDKGTDAYVRNYPFAYDDLLGCGGGIQSPVKVVDGKYRTGAPWNRAIVSDSHLDGLFNRAKQEFDASKQDALYKELFLYILENCYDIAFPRIDGYAAWWPWVKNYRGESLLSEMGEGHIMARIWLDQDLKKAMGK